MKNEIEKRKMNEETKSPLIRSFFWVHTTQSRKDSMRDPVGKSCSDDDGGSLAPAAAHDNNQSCSVLS